MQVPKGRHSSVHVSPALPACRPNRPLRSDPNSRHSAMEPRGTSARCQLPPEPYILSSRDWGINELGGYRARDNVRVASPAPNLEPVPSNLLQQEIPMPQDIIPLGYSFYSLIMISDQRGVRLVLVHDGSNILMSSKDTQTCARYQQCHQRRLQARYSYWAKSFCDLLVLVKETNIRSSCIRLWTYDIYILPIFLSFLTFFFEKVQFCTYCWHEGF